MRLGVGNSTHLFFTKCDSWNSPRQHFHNKRPKFKKAIRDFSWLGILCHALSCGLVLPVRIWPVAETHVSYALPNALAHSVSTMLSKWARVWRTNCRTRAGVFWFAAAGRPALAFFLSLALWATRCVPCEFARFAGDPRARLYSSRPQNLQLLTGAAFLLRAAAGVNCLLDKNVRAYIIDCERGLRGVLCNVCFVWIFCWWHDEF